MIPRIPTFADHVAREMLNPQTGIIEFMLEVFRTHQDYPAKAYCLFGIANEQLDY